MFSARRHVSLVSVVLVLGAGDWLLRTEVLGMGDEVEFLGRQVGWRPWGQE